MELIAKIFQNGRSQAVRIPKAFRFRGNEVKISKKGDKVNLARGQLNRCEKHFKLNKLYQLCAEKFFGGETTFYHP